MKIITHHLFVLLSITTMFVFCSREYNPFTDFANANLYVVHQSIRNRDTLQIFETESLQVLVTVKELVERFSVSATSNRLWPSAETTVVNQEFSQEPFSFFVSFYDTGWQSVVTTVYKTNGSAVAESLHVYLVSPLHQDSVVAFERDSVTLRSPPVKDRDITYFWAFGAGVPYVSPVCSTKVMASSAFFTGKGGLWVWDGKHVSPPDSFGFFLRDTVKPVITCVNTETMINDTIFTSDSILTFRVRITDDLGIGIDSASVNGLAFDGKSGTVYYKLFDKVYTHTSANPLALNVYALDNFQYGNIARTTFWLEFSTTLPQSKKASIRVITPPADTETVNSTAYLVSGSIINNSLDSLSLSLYLSVNNTVNPVVKQITGTSLSWEWPVSLAQGENPVQIIATDNQTGTVVDKKNLLLFCAPNAVDTLPPRILNFLVNGQPAQGLYTDQAFGDVAVEAIDDGTGIDTLYINGKPIPPNGFWYYDTVPLAHVPSGNEIVVVAVDKKKNAVRQTAIVFRNSLPVVLRSPSSAFIQATVLYSDTIRAIDPDNDTLQFQKTQGPSNLSVDQNGVIRWAPGVADTGSQKITIRIWDGYQPVFVSYTLYVSLPGKPLPKPVLFGTRPEDFPQFLVGSKDTLRTVLTVAQGTGLPPFAFTARIVGKTSLLLNNTTDSLIVWEPALADTGYNQLIAIVKDLFPSTDTLYARILVVPPVRPCSISASFTADTLANGALNLDTNRQPFTIVFRVEDPNNPLVERHRVSLTESRTHTTSTFDSALVDTFVYTVDPALYTGYDTIIASVNDGSSADTVSVRLYFGAPPDTPVAVSPLNYAIVTTASVALSFSAHDPDNDTLLYDVYFGSDPNGLSLAASSRDTVATVTGLASNTTYYWRVVARGWKSQTQSMLWQFTTGKAN